jgi:DNA uptake protein ComE-like DNA-binding protein
MPELCKFLLEKLVAVCKKLPRSFLFLIILLSLGMMFFGYGLFQYLYGLKRRENIQHGNFTDSQAISQQENNNFTPPTHIPSVTMISIDVEGAVQKPGVYAVALTSRLQDGLIGAGGLHATADRAWIAKNFNLAATVSDGAKIYIPRVGEQVEGVPVADSTGQLIDSSNVSDLNSQAQPQDNLGQNTPVPKHSPRKKKSRSKAETSTKIAKIQPSADHPQGKNIPISINKASAEELSLKGSNSQENHQQAAIWVDRRPSKEEGSKQKNLCEDKS